MRPALAEWLRREWGAAEVAIAALEPLTGGAIQENWRLEAEVTGGAMAGRHRLVLRTDAASRVAISHARPEEFRLLRAAAAAGVTVPGPLAACADAAVIGRPFFLMRLCPGTADARLLTGTAPHPGLARHLGAELARLHAVRPPVPGLDFLGPPPENPARAAVALIRGLLDTIGAARPALEWGLLWLARHAPDPVAPVLCHRDFRIGNLLVEDGAVTAVLDWEFAGWSDPAEDIGWVSAPCWRFRRPDLDAAGIGTLAELLDGYAAAGGAVPERGRIAWWQVMATARWAAIALAQAARHRTGAERSLELALTFHLVPELELELLTMTRPD